MRHGIGRVGVQTAHPCLQASMLAGGITAVRGSTATVDELCFILQSGKCQALLIQDPEALAKLLPALQQGKVRAPNTPIFKCVCVCACVCVCTCVYLLYRHIPCPELLADFFIAISLALTCLRTCRSPP